MTQTEAMPSRMSEKLPVPKTGARPPRLVPVAIAFAVALGGCSADAPSINLNPFSGGIERSADYNLFYKNDARGSRQVTAADLVGPDGHCAYESAPATAAPYPSAAPRAAAPEPAPAPEATTEPINPRSNQALYFTAGPQANPQQPTTAPSTGTLPPQVREGPRGVALAMTECQVVQLIGNTDRVEIGADGGRRSVTLTYLTGARPGIYRFVDGRLVSMERVEAPPTAPKKAPPRKKTATAKQPT